VIVADAALVEAHPAALVTTSEYVVVSVGLAIGAQDAGLFKPRAGDHAHDTPPDPVSGADWPGLIVVEPAATAMGSGLIVIVTVGLLVEDWPNASTTVSVYVVVAAGLANGEHDVASSRPVAGVHEQETPPEPDNEAVPPPQKIADPDATATGGGGGVPRVTVKAAKS
jgi:hypothetical protein